MKSFAVLTLAVVLAPAALAQHPSFVIHPDASEVKRNLCMVVPAFRSYRTMRDLAANLRKLEAVPFVARRLYGFVIENLEEQGNRMNVMRVPVSLLDIYRRWQR